MSIFGRIWDTILPMTVMVRMTLRMGVLTSVLIHPINTLIVITYVFVTK